jgi:hypothetical protein
LAGLAAALAFLILVGIGLALVGLEVEPGTAPDEVLSLATGIAFALAQFRVLFRGAAGKLPGTGGLSIGNAVAASRCSSPGTL